MVQVKLYGSRNQDYKVSVCGLSLMMEQVKTVGTSHLVEAGQISRSSWLFVRSYYDIFENTCHQSTHGATGGLYLLVIENLRWWKHIENAPISQVWQLYYQGNSYALYHLPYELYYTLWQKLNFVTWTRRAEHSCDGNFSFFQMPPNLPISQWSLVICDTTKWEFLTSRCSKVVLPTVSISQPSALSRQSVVILPLWNWGL